MNRGRRYAFYENQKNQQHRVRWVILGILFFFIIYTSFTSLFFSMGVLENETMAPNLRAGERFIFSSYNIYSLIPGLDLENGAPPFDRGEIVLVDMSGAERPGVFRGIVDGVIRFFTAQRVSLADKSGRKKADYRFIKRVIGLPGDEISMTNFVVRVKAMGSAYSLTEFEVTVGDYTPDIPQAPALWDASIPFSGNMAGIILGENECFVLSDDRSNTNDSRTWGPVPVRNITGKALFRYWPLNRLGRP